MLWQLVQPPERGGLGMAPSEAKKLTPEEAVFYMAEATAVKASARHQEALSDGKTPADVVADHRKMMAELRKRHGVTELPQSSPEDRARRLAERRKARERKSRWANANRAAVVSVADAADE